MKIRKPYGYWQNFDNCKFEASKFQTISEFSKYSSHGYNVARINNWLDDICFHMKKNGNHYNRCIYSCEFSDNSVYVGLTYNFNERKSNHLNITRKKLTTVSKYIIITNLIPKIIKLTDYLPVETAKILENEFLEKYNKDGWIILNINRTGGVGNVLNRWNKFNCHQEALKYKTRNDFRINSSGAYDAAYRNGWLNDITKHMLKYRKYEGYWTKENCFIEALNYKTRTNFARKSSGAYDAAYRNNWLNDICKHMLK